jgi:hypothetical protein
VPLSDTRERYAIDRVRRPSVRLVFRDRSPAAGTEATVNSQDPGTSRCGSSRWNVTQVPAPPKGSVGDRFCAGFRSEVNGPCGIASRLLGVRILSPGLIGCEPTPLGGICRAVSALALLSCDPGNCPKARCGITSSTPGSVPRISVRRARCVPRPSLPTVRPRAGNLIAALPTGPRMTPRSPPSRRAVAPTASPNPHADPGPAMTRADARGRPPGVRWLFGRQNFAVLGDREPSGTRLIKIRSEDSILGAA